MSKHSVLCILKRCFDQQENPSKKIQNDYTINNLQFRVTCIILRNLQNTNLLALFEKLNSLQFSNKNMLESAQKIKKNDLYYYVINHQ